MTNRTETVLTNAVATIALIGCLVYVHWLFHFDLNPPDPVDAPASAQSSNAAEPSMKREEERSLWFGKYPCGNDCSQNLAGYRWARENGITEPDNCDGSTAPFIEGCRVYAEQRRVGMAAN